MAIVSPTEPPQGQQVLQGVLSYLLSRNDAPWTQSALGGASVDQVQYTQPHMAYSIGVDALASGQFLDAAQPMGWRYLLIDPSGAKSLAEVYLATGSDGNLAFSAVSYGPTGPATVDALSDLEQNNASVQSSDYELRYLQVPALAFFALWLHGASDDIIRPIPPTPVTVMDPVAMAPSQVQPGLQQAAQAVQAQQTQFSGPSGG
ncbi:MAG TPA: hypothetical protein VIF15_10275 [Polyangiaceae bacterium]|jgi:hypothetical protein